MPKELLNLTINEFVDTLVDWAKKGGNYLFHEQFAKEKVIKREGKQGEYKYDKDGQLLLYYALTPLILASDYCESKESLLAYANAKSLGKDVLKASLHKGLLKDFSDHLLRKGCCMESKEKTNSFEKFKYFFEIEVYDYTDHFNDHARIREHIIKALDSHSETRPHGNIPLSDAIKIISNHAISDEQLTKKHSDNETKILVEKVIPKKVINKLLEKNDKSDVCMRDVYESLTNYLFEGAKDEMVGPNSDKNYEAYETAIENAIKGGSKQIILTGAPGTGKTRMAKEIANKLGAKIPNADGNYMFVQFHPSYDYTDFVEGLRPVAVKKSTSAEDNKSTSTEDNKSTSTIEFQRVDGIFKRFCRMVAKENNRKDIYFFLIDEINRADLSKVFGELMYCLESDKRGPENRVQTPYQNLPTYFPDKPHKTDDEFKDGFYIPENVYIIGTMNDIDRSVESMDFALRRRFLWMEIEVTQPLLKGAFKSKDFWYKSDKDTDGDDAKGEREKKAKALTDKAPELAERVMKMNELMTKSPYKDFGLNKQYYISQGQFANLPVNVIDKCDESDPLNALVDFVWNWRIKPLLKEYVRGEEEEKVDKFLDACEKALKESKVTANSAAPQAQDTANADSTTQQ